VLAIRKSIGSLLLAGVCLTAAAASAQGLGGGLRFGTPGIGLSLESVFVTEHFGIRGLVDGGSAAYDYDQGRAPFDGQFRLGTGVLLADWHPYASGFRLSGGLLYNSQRFTGTAQSSGRMNVNGMPYSSVGLLDGRMAVSRTTPYLGVGWGLTPRPGSRLYFSADLGVMYQRPSAMLSGACVPGLSASACSQLHHDELDFREGTDDLRLYPVISVGFGLRF
jgi:hypothetical protein